MLVAIWWRGFLLRYQFSDLYGACVARWKSAINLDLYSVKTNVGRFSRINRVCGDVLIYSIKNRERSVDQVGCFVVAGSKLIASICLEQQPMSQEGIGGSIWSRRVKSWAMTFYRFARG